MPEAVSRPQTPCGRFQRRCSIPSRPPTPSDAALESRGAAAAPITAEEPPLSPPMSPPAASSIRELPRDVVAEALSHLDAGDLPSAELSCRAVRGILTQRDAWKAVYGHQCNRNDDWRMPEGSPPNWKRFYHRARKERALSVAAKIPGSSAKCMWRVALPLTAEHSRKRSREFMFSSDALGQPIRWQIELELYPGVPLREEDVDQPGTPASVMLNGEDGKPHPYRQSGLVRMWTTNQWTTESTRHYYGSHCTMSIRDPLDSYDILPQVAVDIDNSHALEFDASVLPACREVLVSVDLTLALEVMAPLDPFYSLIASEENGSDIVRIGYCKAVFEIARCKRKYGGTFIRPCDRDIRAMVDLAGSDSTSERLRVEVFQALFNLLGPTSVLLDDEVVLNLLGACFHCLKQSPVPCSHLGMDEQKAATSMAQNSLGAVFNLLVHPLCSYACCRDPDNVWALANLLNDPAYTTCVFSVITILMTVHAWGGLPADLVPLLEAAATEFMAQTDPLDSDCTGVAWDESDVAAFFLPLLRSRPLICVRFASFCMGKYYFPREITIHDVVALGTMA